MSTPLEPVESTAPQKVDPIDNLTENLQLFWFKHQNTIYTVVSVILLAIVGKGVWDWNRERIERETGAAYAAASTTEQLQAFVAAHEGHVLSGAAQLRIGDELFSQGKHAEASAAYAAAITALGESPFAARARLGQAIAQVLAGNTAEGESSLRKLAEDASTFKGLRAEAAYHLATLVAEAGRTDESRKLCELILQVDAQGFWGERAIELRSSLPEDTGSAPAAGGSPAAPAAEIKLAVPGK